MTLWWMIFLIISGNSAQTKDEDTFLKKKNRLFSVLEVKGYHAVNTVLSYYICSSSHQTASPSHPYKAQANSTIKGNRRNDILIFSS